MEIKQGIQEEMSNLPITSHTIVIGAGPAGLAVGACLKQAGIPCLLLEQRDKVGSAWHRHYDRLHLHTDKKNSELPLLPFPKEYPRYPSRTQITAYLESYAQKFQLDIRFHQQVTSAGCENNLWDVQTQDKLYRAKNLVIATGYTRAPFLPTWPGQELFKGILMHSSEYKNGERFRAKKALVVGFGNSGGEIAIDLWEHGAQVGLSVRSAVNVIPRDLFGIPILSIGILQSKLSARVADAINAPILRFAVGDITRYGLQKLPYGPITQIRRDAHIPLIDVGTLKLIRNGQITVHKGIREFTENGVIFDDEKQAQFDAVILATGYRPRVNEFLTGLPAAVYDESGTPLSSGRETGLPGLYFCGYFVAATGMFREIGIEAKQISASIAAKKLS
ncbi:MAG TPA: NAD(P)/FAD-dependent oxidoreductase [Anaerolineales bacterium]|nr:NAD(P)/FAD-dependent oxidoreductase [Anaerolineales bacterium]